MSWWHFIWPIWHQQHTFTLHVSNTNFATGMYIARLFAVYFLPYRVVSSQSQPFPCIVWLSCFILPPPKHHQADPEKLSDLWPANMSNVHKSKNILTYKTAKTSSSFSFTFILKKYIRQHYITSHTSNC